VVVSNDEISGEGSSGGMPPYVLPVVTALMALLAGGALGALVVWVVKQPEIVEKAVPRDLTEAELTAACAPLVTEVAENLEAANDKVTTLVDEVKAKEARVQELEAEMKKRSARGAQLVKELEQARAELEEVKAQLKQAIEEKEALVVELKQTLADLDTQKEETRQAKVESIHNNWDSFVAESQLEICERGTRKKLGKCREAVTAYLDAEMKAKYEHCLKSGQEEPKVREAGKDEELPVFASYLDQENKIVKDYYVLLCDPSLPEAKGFADEGTASRDRDEPDGTEADDEGQGSLLTADPE
jgi:hypothetical protein